jgi:hypothetical protein
MHALILSGATSQMKKNLQGTENLKATKKHVKNLCFMVIACIVYHGPSDQWHWFLELILCDIPTTILDPHGPYYEFFRGFDNERYRWKLTSLTPKTSLGVGRTHLPILTGVGDTCIPASCIKVMICIQRSCMGITNQVFIYHVAHLPEPACRYLAVSS